VAVCPEDEMNPVLCERYGFAPLAVGTSMTFRFVPEEGSSRGRVRPVATRLFTGDGSLQALEHGWTRIWAEEYGTGKLLDFTDLRSEPMRELVVVDDTGRTVDEPVVLYCGEREDFSGFIQPHSESGPLMGSAGWEVDLSSEEPVHTSIRSNRIEIYLTSTCYTHGPETVTVTIRRPSHTTPTAVLTVVTWPWRDETDTVEDGPDASTDVLEDHPDEPGDVEGEDG
jgi:hypothetical protein